MNHEEENLTNTDLAAKTVHEPLDENVETEELSAENHLKDDKQPLIKSRKIYVIGGLILASVIAVLIWLYLQKGSEGKPVPAPRNVSFGETSNGNNALSSGEQTITISPEQLENANLKIEKVGEAFSQESSATSATGVVQANAYAETPVISLVGGVVRQINAELGQFVARGQTVAVVYSDELAGAESQFLTKRAEMDEARKRYERALKLTDIASESRTEIDNATAEVKISEAKLAEEKSEFERMQKLVRIGAVSREDFEKATTDLKTAEAKLTEAKNRFERAKRLLNINPQRRAELDNALTQLRTAEAELASERQKLLVLGLSPQKVNSLKSISQISAELPILSPVSGTITARMVNQGEVISANKELLQVTNLSTVWVIGQVYEKDLARLRTGSGASITTDAYPDEVFRGNITYIDPNLDQNTRTAQVRIEVPNPDQKLKIGMYVNIAFATIGGSENTVPTVPKEAVQNINNQQVVFVATDNPNVFALRPVKIGAESNGFYPVSEGLFVGDRVVTEGSFLLRAEWQKSHPNGF